MEDFGFIIPSYCDSDLHLLQLERCIGSIRKYHDNTIIIIDDYSKSDIESVVNKFRGVKIIKSTVKGGGDMSTYDVFRDHKFFQKAIIIQDSMTVEKKFDNIDSIDKISYIWYFTNHRLHWSHIKEPQNEYNIKNNIKVHDDLVLDCIDKLIKLDGFKQFAKDIYHNKNKWSGCFGCLTIIDYDFMLEFDNKTGIIEILKNFNNNRLRRASESIFALACLYVLDDDVFEKAYDGLYYDGVNPQNNIKNLKASELGIGNDSISVYQVCKNDYISKVSFNRN